MNFDTLVEKYLIDLEEGRKQKADKFSNFEIDTQKLNEKLENGTFDVIITAWANHSKYGNITTEQLKNVIKSVSNEVEEYGINTYDDLKSTVESITDSVYENKGLKRKTLVDRLTKAVINLIFHKEYDLVNLNVESRPEPEDEFTGLTNVENAVVDFIDHSDEPVTLEVLNKHFSGADSIVDSLVQKKVVFVNPSGIISLIGDISGTDVLDDRENPLEADEDVRAAFSRTMGQNYGDEFDLEKAYQDPESVSWIRR